MWRTLKDLSLGLALLAAASATLLLSDLPSRQRQGENGRPGVPGPAGEAIPVAILQHASNAIFEETSRGIIDGLAAHGYRDGERIRLQRFNAEGDIPTANLIASRLGDGSFKLVATASTVCLQAVANANRHGNATQVFCAVSDPVAAGVGIQSLDSLDKPKHLTGIGTAQPVEEIFRLAKKFRPELRVVGVVWNPAEANSEVCTRRARKICGELGIKLIEAPIEGTRDVREAAQSLVQRGAEACWVGGDATVLNAIEVLITVTKQGRIPVFSNIGGHIRQGALFDLGANYYQVGSKAGEIAAAILSGRSAAEIPVENYVPSALGLNLQALAGLRDTWSFPAATLKEAVTVIQPDGTAVTKQAATATATTSAPAAPPVSRKPFRISALAYTESVPTEESLQGLRTGLTEAGMIENTDYVFKYRSAQGEMAILPSLFAAAEMDKPDLFLVLSTPTLQTAAKRVKNTPVVFTLVADPMMANVGRSNEDHLPNITGVYVMSRYDDMAELIQKYYPQWKRIGSLVAPAEDNSVRVNELFGKELARRGITLVNVAVNTSGEMAEASTALCGRQIDAVVQVPCNLVSAGFTALSESCRRSRMPLFGFIQDAARHGASVVLSRDYTEAGVDAGKIAARILRGEDPAKIPFAPPTKTVLMVSPAAARAQGITIPPELLKKADQIVQ